MKRVAVLLTVHNRRDKTISCLEKLYACRVPEGYAIDVYLTDDGSTDATADAVKQKYPDIMIIAGDGNLFWCRGMNEAWKAAVATPTEYCGFLWLNDDTFLFEDALMTLYETISLHPDSLVGGAVCSKVDGHMTYGGLGADEVLLPLSGEPRKVVYLNGNVVFVPYSVYEKTGTLDGRFLHGIADYDYSLMAAEYGFGVYMAARYVGNCESHYRFPDWCNWRVPLLRRFKALNSPLGCPPKVLYYYRRKHGKGVLPTLMHCSMIYIRVLFPFFWKKKS